MLFKNRETFSGGIPSAFSHQNRRKKLVEKTPDATGQGMGQNLDIITIVGGITIHSLAMTLGY